MTDHIKKEILGVKIDDISMSETLKTIDQWIVGGEKHYIVTTNPEFIVTAQKDREFREVLNGADLSIPDGFGLNLFGGVRNRVAGTDLVCALTETSYNLYFLGSKRGIAKKAFEVLKEKNERLKGAFGDGPENCLDETESLEWIQKINESGTDILFIAFGHPKQEKWIDKYLGGLDVKVAIGVGGAFDYISQTTPRAPEILRKIGLEWLFRLIMQPQRSRRIYNAIIVFPVLLLQDKFFTSNVESC